MVSVTSWALVSCSPAAAAISVILPEVASMA
jgi:hypothetical protein